MNDNRRRQSRYALGSKVTVTMNDVILQGTACENISSGGMCIKVDDRIDSCDDGMLMLIQKYGDEVIFFKTDFTVTWNNIHSPDRYNACLGISFKELDDINKEALEKIISYQTNLPN